MPKACDIKIRIKNKIIILENGCWEWNTSKQKDGYGTIGKNGKCYLAHRISYELFKGEIPKGLELDHVCRNRSCINPDHLEPVTHKLNMERSSTAVKTHCKNGHLFSPDNIYWCQRKYGFQRACRICGRIANRLSDRKKRGACQVNQN